MSGMNNSRFISDRSSKYYESFEAEEIKINNPGKYHMDGEPRTSETDLIIRIVPKSLKVIC